MSLSVADGENQNSLNISQVLADFFLKKIEMPSYSDDSDFRHRSKKKKSKHKKRKHKKVKHRHRSSSSDSNKSTEINDKHVVDDVSSSEEMGMKRLEKIKNMKLHSANKNALQSTTTAFHPKEDKMNADMKETVGTSDKPVGESVIFYGPSLELLLSGVKSDSKCDVHMKASDTENNESTVLRCDMNKKDNDVDKCDSDLEKKSASTLGLIQENSANLNSFEQSDNILGCHKGSNNIHNSTCSNNTKDYDSCTLDIMAKDNQIDIRLCDNEIKSVNEIENVISDLINKENESNTNENYIQVESSKQKHKRNHSRSHSRSRSHSKSDKCISPKPRDRTKSWSRSSSSDSCHSKTKRKRYSRSRSRSCEKSKFYHQRRQSCSRGYSQSYSRSRYSKYKRSSHSRSPFRKQHRRTRSRSHSRIRNMRYSDSKTRRNRSRQREYSSFRSSRRSISHSRSRSKSKSKNILVSAKVCRSHSRSKSKERKSAVESNKIDQAKVLETARKNVLKMMKSGTLPEGLPIENLKKEQLISFQAGGKSVQELTDFCQRLSQTENDPNDYGDNIDDDDDKPDDETGFIHHPFKVKEPGMIKMNIKNAVQLPIKTHAQKVAETARLSSQFPVSSGNQHKQKELEWVPVIPETSKTESRPAETVTSTKQENSSTVSVLETSVSSAVASSQMPVSYPCPSVSEMPQVMVPMSLPSLISPTVSSPILPPPLPLSVPTSFQTPQSVMQSYPVPNQQQMITTDISTPIIPPSPSVFRPPKKLDISAIVAKRFQALTKLQENPNDPDALKAIQEAEGSIQEWVQSQHVPGLFTGSTDAKVLSAAELCGPKGFRFRKDIFTQAPPVTEGKGMSLLKKMGWNPGEGLGKNKEGSLEPLLLDIKMDKKGLVSEGEDSKKGASSFTKELQGKHPVSALMELCSKRRWKPPLYTCVLDHGPPHKKLFCFKVEVNGIEYQPLNPCSNKKVAKADSAILCLQALNVFPKNP